MNKECTNEVLIAHLSTYCTKYFPAIDTHARDVFQEVVRRLMHNDEMQETLINCKSVLRKYKTPLKTGKVENDFMMISFLIDDVLTKEAG